MQDGTDIAHSPEIIRPVSPQAGKMVPLGKGVLPMPVAYERIGHELSQL